MPVAYFVMEVLLILVILISARDKIPAHTITTDIHDFGHEQWVDVCKFLDRSIFGNASRFSLLFKYHALSATDMSFAWI